MKFDSAKRDSHLSWILKSRIYVWYNEFIRRVDSLDSQSIQSLPTMWKSKSLNRGIIIMSESHQLKPGYIFQINKEIK